MSGLNGTIGPRILSANDSISGRIRGKEGPKKNFVFHSKILCCLTLIQRFWFWLVFSLRDFVFRLY